MVKFAQITDVGRVRDHNEDNLISMPEQGVWLVADGMGGYEAGEVASTIVVEDLPELLEQGLELSEVLAITHRNIHKAVEQGRGEAGMGSTAVLLRIDGNSYEIAWVGDSRAYLWDGSSLMQLTRDHSFVQQLLDSGAITEEEAQDHPQRNVISQALGADMVEVRVDAVKGKLAKGDKILLCSDGLTSELTDGEIAVMFTRNESCEIISKCLVDAANKSGGSDNITLIIVEAPEDAPARVKRGETRPMKVIHGISGKKKNLALLYGIAGFLLASVPVLIWVFMGQKEKTSVLSGGAGEIGPSPVKMQIVSEVTVEKDIREVLSGTGSENTILHPTSPEKEKMSGRVNPEDDLSPLPPDKTIEPGTEKTDSPRNPVQTAAETLPR